MIPKSIVIATLVVGVVLAEEAPSSPPPSSSSAASNSPASSTPKVVQIKSYEATFDREGKYHWAYESEDGSKAQQDGEVKVVNQNSSELVASGAFSYKSDDGNQYSVNYVADENGYQPQGDHLPQAPPIPPLIQRALDYLATAPTPKDEEQGSTASTQGAPAAPGAAAPPSASS